MDIFGFCSLLLKEVINLIISRSIYLHDVASIAQALGHRSPLIHIKYLPLLTSYQVSIRIIYLFFAYLFEQYQLICMISKHSLFILNFLMF